jgi:hypothetical protein
VTLHLIQFGRTREILTAKTLAVITTKHCPLEAFTVFLETHAFLAIATCCVALLVVHFGLECLGIPLLCDQHSPLSFFLVTGAVVALHTITIVTVFQSREALTVQLQALALLAIAVTSSGISANRGDVGGLQAGSSHQHRWTGKQIVSFTCSCTLDR